MTKKHHLPLEPLGARVIVKRMEEAERTLGGILLPDSAKEKPQKGTILAVGPGESDQTGKIIPLTVKVGDIVLFAKWGGTEVTVEGEDYLIMKESDIIAKCI